MKPDIHPDYQKVVFQDTSVTPHYSILTRSTASSSETIEWEDGNTYPLIKMEVSSASHPFFTGKQRLVDTAGMVERYRRRYGTGTTPAEAAGESAPSQEASIPAGDTPADPAPEAVSEATPEVVPEASPEPTATDS